MLPSNNERERENSKTKQNMKREREEKILTFLPVFHKPGCGLGTFQLQRSERL